ncbi:Por secretion system C-terminal sorting domain-containing protein [Reichenbachiella faecimaris]|uniref:Por secretion system C-terminal sorting domain-containing protein n=1 Tax=Reichenbachiella faecimaris TaxID=692418 RepID=A0A1W2GAX3_REIFA|nr:T9SS type A sorting domain-containing protein [Reichenbachiella faecimaris]SMD33830.1 Por secretion system C-terminal sorting domain-containing protein [Reichenbachiella faecimaris]
MKTFLQQLFILLIVLTTTQVGYAQSDIVYGFDTDEEGWSNIGGNTSIAVSGGQLVMGTSSSQNRPGIKLNGPLGFSDVIYTQVEIVVQNNTAIYEELEFVVFDTDDFNVGNGEKVVFTISTEDASPQTYIVDIPINSDNQGYLNRIGIRLNETGVNVTDMFAFESITLLAETGDYFDLTIDQTGYGTVSPSTSNLPTGDVTIYASPALGYELSSWGGDGSGSDNPYVFTLDAAKTVTANFTAISSFSYDWTFGTDDDQEDWVEASATTSVASDVLTMSFDGTGTPKIVLSDLGIPSDDYPQLELIVKNNTTVLGDNDTNADGMRIVTTNDNADTKYIRFDHTASDADFQTYTIDLAGGNYTGYITNLELQGIRDGNPGSIEVENIRLISALPEHALTTAATGYGLVDVASGTYPEGDLEITATPTLGHEFVNWTGDVTSTDNPLTLTLDADKSVTANFSPITDYTYEWEFDTDDDTEGWTTTTNATATVASGVVNLAFDGSGRPKLIFDALALVADDYPFMEVTVKNNTAVDSESGDGMRVATYNGTDFAFTFFDHSASDVEFHTYTIDLRTAKYNGIIQQIEVHGIHGATVGNVDIDRVRLLQKADQTITFEALDEAFVGQDPFELTATASSSLEVTYASGNTDVATVSGSTVTIVGEGTAVITASQVGDDLYNAATDVEQTLTVSTVDLWALVVSQSGYGTVDIASGSYPEGDIDLTAASVFGHEFVNWTGDVTSTDNPLTLTLDADKGITANFSPTLDFVYDWGFDTDDDMEDWINQSADVTVEGGLATMAISGNVPKVVRTGLAIPTENYPVISVRLKNNTAVDGTDGSTCMRIATGISGESGYNYYNFDETVVPIPDGEYEIYNIILGERTSYTGFLEEIQFIGPRQLDLEDPDVLATASVVIDYIKLSTMADQFIDVTAVDAYVGGLPVELPSTSNAGLEITYESSNTSVATVEGNILTIVATEAATAEITANQAGNEYYNAAPEVTVALNVTVTDLYDLTITKTGAGLVDVATGTYPTGEMTLEATSVLGYEFSSWTGDVISTDNPLTINLTTDLAIEAIFTRDESFSFEWNFDTDDDMEGWVTNSNAEATVSGGVLTMNITGNAPKIEYYDLGIDPDDYVMMEISLQNNTGVGPDDGSSTNMRIAYDPYDPTEDPEPGFKYYNIDGTANDADQVVYQIPLADQANYRNVDFIEALGFVGPRQQGSGTVVIDYIKLLPKQSQSITFDELVAVAEGDAAFNLTASASSGLDVTYSSSNLDVATVDGHTVTIVGAGTTEITASQEGDYIYLAAEDQVQTLTVNGEKLDQVITISTISDQWNTRTESINIEASTNSSLTLDYDVTGPATLTGSALTLTGELGTVTVSVSQEGDDTYKSASESISFDVVSCAEVTLSLATTHISCFGSDDGAIDLTVNGPEGYAVSWSSGSDAEDVSALSPGEYTAIVTYEGGCSLTESVTLTSPVALTVEADVTDGEIALTVAGGTSPYSFDWSHGVTSQNVSGLSAGEYTVAITDENGCEVSGTYMVETTVTAVSPNDFEFTVSVFPNPVSEYLTLNSNLENIQLNIEVLDMSGKLLMSKEVNDNNHQLSLGQLQAGQYLLKISTRNNSMVHHVIKR